MRTRSLPTLLCATLVLAAAGAHTPTYAQVTLSSQIAVPYTGYLDQDGVPFDGRAQLRFRLLTVPAGGVAPEEACAGVAPCLWEELHPEVTVHAGAFSVALGRPVGGQPTPLGAVLAEDQQLYVEVAIRANDGLPFATMGRQAIHPVPAAVWAAPRNLTVDRLQAATATLGVVDATAVTTGTADVTGLLTTADARIRATSVATATLNADQATVTGGVSAAYFQATGPSPKLRNVLTIGADCHVQDGAPDGQYCHTPVGNKMCFLTRYHQDNGGNAGDVGYCHVTNDAANWYLNYAAQVDMHLSCSMRCLSW